MHGLNKSIDLQFLKSREVIQVAIGIYQVIFAFDDDVTISVEGRFEYISSSGACEWRPGASHVAATTVNLLGKTVKAVQGQEDGTLELVFSNGDRLVIRDANKEYESYQITRRGETIVA